MKAVPSGYTDSVELLTLGHGTLTQEALADEIRQAGIERLVDVRTVPKSRAHPWVWRDQMETWVPAQSGAAYEWERELGGFRPVKKDSHNTALRNASFRGYADYMESDAFRTALARVLNEARRSRVAVMCSETLWWRCHRRLIADAATLLHDAAVRHLMPGGKSQPHALTQGVRRDGETLRYDGQAA